MTTTVCGIDCRMCDLYQKDCAGCNEIKGCVFWASMFNQTVCPIYDCAVNEKKYKNCGQCEKLPCEIYSEVKDPATTDEEHKARIKERVERLRG